MDPLEKIILDHLEPGDLIERDGVYAEFSHRQGDFFYDIKGGEIALNEIRSITLLRDNYTVEFNKDGYVEEHEEPFEFDGEREED